MRRIFVFISFLTVAAVSLRTPVPCSVRLRMRPLYSTATGTSVTPSNSKRPAESGAAMKISDVNLSIGNNDIISSINWTIMPKERWALVGPNGVGKSTLLKALTGAGGENVMVRDGSISVAKKARLGYLEQKGVSGSTLTVRDEVASRMDRLQAATQALELAEARVTDGDTSEEALLELERANTEFETAGGYTVEQKIGSILKGLGFVEDDYERSCSEFSGGWQMRIALARLLLSEPDLLFLDEPTNHLDKGARDWLGRYLADYDGTLLLVSHDEQLLGVAANSIAEVCNGRVDLYKSRSRSQWLVEREERVRVAQAEYEANQREIGRLQGYVDRFGAKTMGASLAQSKLKTIEKLRENGPEMPVGGDGPKPVLRLAAPPRAAKILLSMNNVSLAWKQASTPTSEPVCDVVNTGGQDDTTRTTTNAPDNNDGNSDYIIQGCDLTIERGMRIAVRGPNGAGKSTLLTALSGKLPTARGERVEGDGLRLGVFTQDLAQDLDQHARAVDVVTSTVREYDPALSDETARSVLGALGLRGEKALRQVGHLSGGEKARVALAGFVLIPHNLLLLDEPSNHLDVQTISVLTEALRDFNQEGAVLVISHDKPFLEALQPTHVVTVRDGSVTMEERGLRASDWNDPLNSRSSSSSSSKFSSSSNSNGSNKNAAAAGTTAAAVGTANGEAAALTPSQSPPSPPPPPPPSTSSATVPAPPPLSVAEEEARRKKALNAPRRIKKIENSLQKYEEEMVEIDASMLQNGTKRDILLELQTKKDTLQSKIEKLYAEYEDLIDYV